MSTNHVCGQSGRGGLARLARLYFAKAELNASKKREVRYMVCRFRTTSGFTAYVSGPLHSRTYGVSGFGTTSEKAVANLRQRLSNDYGFIGRLKRSFSDESDGDNYQTRHVEPMCGSAKRLSAYEAVGTAGM